jgi:membrane-associated phospholipid phosphatase
LVVIAAAAVVMSASPARAQDVPSGFDLDAALTVAVREALAEPTAPPAAPIAVAPPAQDATPPPTPAHTGLTALAVDTWGDFKSFPQRPSTWVILSAAGAGALAVHPLDDNVVNHFENSTGGAGFWAPGKYIGGIGMAVAPVAIYVLGRYVFAPAADEPQTNKWSHLGFDLIRAQIVNETFVQALKFTVQRTRPNGDNYSFPSGHSAATFAFASVLERHFGYRFAWPTVAIASYVAASRLHDNVHYLSDVVFGAGLGTAVGWTVVGRHGRDSYAIVPAIGPHTVTFTLTRAPSRAAASQ